MSPTYVAHGLPRPHDLLPKITVDQLLEEEGHAVLDTRLQQLQDTHRTPHGRQTHPAAGVTDSNGVGKHAAALSTLPQMRLPRLLLVAVLVLLPPQCWCLLLLLLVLLLSHSHAPGSCCCWLLLL